MLKSLDVLIGLVLVLLALSMVVTIITQSITTMFNTRGYHLRRGLVDLLRLLDPAFDEKIAKKIATAVLTHPLTSGSNVLFTAQMRLGSVIHRDELTKLLMALGQGNAGVALDTDARTRLAAVLRDNGIPNPDQALATIRDLALDLEAKYPDLSNAARQDIAILNGARSAFVAKINNWFDQTVDRTSQRFTGSTRLITFAGAIIVAVGLQVDTLSLANRLAADDQLRNAFVAEAQKAQPPGTAATDTTEIETHYRAFLAEYGVIKLPGADWWKSFQRTSLQGMLVTALLLSLGAPFWYSMLGQLLQLRSVLATKDDAQRQARQDQPPSGATAGGSGAGVGASAAAAALVAGERGDLTAVG